MDQFKYFATVNGTRMFRGIVDGDLCIKPEWSFDPFQNANPCFLWTEGINAACVKAADLAQSL